MNTNGLLALASEWRADNSYDDYTYSSSVHARKKCANELESALAHQAQPLTDEHNHPNNGQPGANCRACDNADFTAAANALNDELRRHLRGQEVTPDDLRQWFGARDRMAQQAQPETEAACRHLCQHCDPSEACTRNPFQQAQPEMPTREKFENELHERNAGHAGRDWVISIGSALEAFDALFAPKADDAAEDRAYVTATGGVPFDHWGKGCPNDCAIPQHQEHKA